ncbi:MAG: hypothetical protein OQK12_07030 [Motiliproteus sp.]|nr:hypothetical protein [Motiliproteus sp.]
MKKRRQAGGRVGLHLGADGVSVAHYNPSLEPSLNQCQWIPSASLENPEPLKQQIDAWGLEGAKTSVVLAHGEYQLMLVEAPDVAKAELKEALRWRVKDLVSFEVADAIVDYFPLPDDAYHGRSNMLYVVAIPHALSERIESFVEAAGLNLDVIDIPELALMNLMQPQEGDLGLGQALLCLQEPNSYINLVSDQALYLTRTVETPRGLIDVDEVQAEDYASAMILNIQRSLDYYESQIGKPPCLRLLVCPLQEGETPLLGQFRHNLGVDLQQLDLEELVSSREPLTPEFQNLVVLAVAGALRQEAGK